MKINFGRLKWISIDQSTGRKSESAKSWLFSRLKSEYNWLNRISGGLIGQLILLNLSIVELRSLNHDGSVQICVQFGILLSGCPRSHGNLSHVFYLVWVVVQSYKSHKSISDGRGHNSLVWIFTTSIVEN